MRQLLLSAPAPDWCVLCSLLEQVWPAGPSARERCGAAAVASRPGAETRVFLTLGVRTGARAALAGRGGAAPAAEVTECPGCARQGRRMRAPVLSLFFNSPPRLRSGARGRSERRRAVAGGKWRPRCWRRRRAAPP